MSHNQHACKVQERYLIGIRGRAGKVLDGAELFKADPELAATILTPFFTKIWEQEEIQSDWSRGVVIKIPKKGSLSDCNNWRGITLLSVPSKIFCKVIIQHITQAVDDILRNKQARFCKGADAGIKFLHYGIYLSNVLSI